MGLRSESRTYGSASRLSLGAAVGTVEVVLMNRCGVCVLVLLALTSLKATASQLKDQQRANYFSDLRTAKFAGIAMLEYVSRHGGRLPDARRWEESIKPYWSEGLYTVSIKEHPGDRLAMNSKLSGMKLKQVLRDCPDIAIMLYETHSPGRDVRGAPSSWKQYHECNGSTRGSQMIVFADGWAGFYVPGTGLDYALKK